MPSSPPFRLETVRDVQAYFGGKRRAGAADVLAFARAHAIVKPPLLGRIPARFEVEILDVKREFRTVVRSADHAVDVKTVVDFVGDRRRRLLAMLGEPAPRNRAALTAALVREGRPLAAAGRGAAHHRGAGRRDAKRSEASHGLTRRGEQCERRRPGSERRLAGLEDMLDLRDLQGELMRRWLSTRDPKIGAFLEKALATPLLYDRASGELDRERVHQLRRLPDRSALLIQELHDLFGERLATASDVLYRPAVYAFVRAACRRVLSLAAPANLRRGVVTLIESIHRREDGAAVQTRLERLCDVHHARTGARSLRRIADVVANLLDKLSAFDAFFDLTFARDRLHAYHRAFCHASRVEEVSVETVLGRKMLVLYPCKDYHEFMKGRYSRDCTREASLAGRHLRNPRFFNLRVFIGGKWIGNIYMLDYTAASNAVILDRIQIASTADLMPADFVPPLVSRLESVITGPGGHSLLGPSAISNFAPIQQSYLRYRRLLSKARIRPPREDYTFESVRGGILYVLGEARPQERATPPRRAVSAPRVPGEPTLFPE